MMMVSAVVCEGCRYKGGVCVSMPNSRGMRRCNFGFCQRYDKAVNGIEIVSEVNREKCDD